MQWRLWLASLGIICVTFGVVVARGDDAEDMYLDEDAADLIDGFGEHDLLNEVDDDPIVTTTTPAPVVDTVPYKPPSSAGLTFLETFDGAVFSRWVKSTDAKFLGRWENVKREIEAIKDDLGLRIMDEAMYHGISTRLPSPMKENKGKELALSYEVKFEDVLNCGGAYLKLFDSSVLPSEDMGDFNHLTPYIVMFGPDRCGATNKVHLIIKQLNPLSGDWVEHHLVDPPRVPFGKLTHQYGFVLRPDNTYSVLVDGKVEKEGSMRTDFVPSFTPPEEIDDPQDKKPEDWVDQAKIADPHARKPDDWDENAPRHIPDPDAVMPEGWLEDEQRMISDPHATEPDNWDEEEDGRWTAPLIPNPACESAPGCGKWIPPYITNPDFKGEWSPPMIDNPDYKGPWVPRKVPNPHYFVSEFPHGVADFDSVGFELWTMQKGILFDNIAMSRSLRPIEDFVGKTFAIRSAIEAAMERASSPTTSPDIGFFSKAIGGATMFAQDKPILFAAGVAAVLFSLVGMIKVFKKKPVPIAPTQVPPPAESPAEEPKANSTEESTGEAAPAEDSETTEPTNAEQEELSKKETTPTAHKRKARKA